MKALTICQPFAELIVRGDKRVENRVWGTSYRGPLLIHAGKSRDWLDLDEQGTRDETYDIPLAEMAFGALVGVCELIDCVRLTESRVALAGLSINGREFPPQRRIQRTVPRSAAARHPWLASHEHTEGPYCLVLANVLRFQEPIPWRGAQGLFEVALDLTAIKSG